MTPHLFPSIVCPGKWVCVDKRLSSDPRRAYEPVPNAPTVYGDNPRHAYERWLEYARHYVVRQTDLSRIVNRKAWVHV